MRVGLNLLYLIPGEVGGTEIYARELLNALGQLPEPSSLVAFVNREAEDWPLPARVERVLCPVHARRRWQRYLYEQSVMPSLVRRKGIEVLHSLGYVAPVFSRLPSVVTVHDLNFQTVGADMSISRRIALRTFVSASLRTVTRVVTDSRASRTQILAYMNLKSEKVVVVHLGGDHRLRDQPVRYSAFPSPYFLAFSSSSRHKNIGALLSAFRKASTHEAFDHRLVIIGHLRPAEAAVASTIAGVETAGQIGDAAVSGFLANADFLVVPSIYEGFGLPVAEAMSLGVPCLLANRASLPEVGGDAAMLFDPTDTNELAALLVMAARDRALRQRLSVEALARAPLFSWKSAAEQMLAVYRACQNQ